MKVFILYLLLIPLVYNMLCCINFAIRAIHSKNNRLYNVILVIVSVIWCCVFATLIILFKDELILNMVIIGGNLYDG